MPIRIYAYQQDWRARYIANARGRSCKTRSGAAGRHGESTLQQASVIRSNVAALREGLAETEQSMDANILERLATWAHDQADRIDPVPSGGILDSMVYRNDEPDD